MIALGLIHVALTREATGGWFSPEALFFAGSGVAILLLGLLNLILNRADHDAYVRALGMGSNGLGVVLFAVGVVILPEPQVFLLLMFVVVEFLCSLLLPRRSRREPEL